MAGNNANAIGNAAADIPSKGMGPSLGEFDLRADPSIDSTATSTYFPIDPQGSVNPKVLDRPDSIQPAPGTTADGSGGILDGGDAQQVTSTNYMPDSTLPLQGKPGSLGTVPDPDVLNRGYVQPGAPGVPTTASQARTGANRQRLGNRYQRGNGSDYAS